MSGDCADLLKPGTAWPLLGRRSVVGALVAAIAPAAPLRAATWATPEGTSARLIPVEGGVIDVLVEGHGPSLLMIPSFGRPREDFDEISRTFVADGYQVIRPQPRGIGGSINHKTDFDLADMAKDVATVLQTMGGGAAVVLGHAYGQRIARSVATDYPELVRSLIMVACGGKVAAAPEVVRAVKQCFDRSLSDAAHMAAVRYAFFAPGNDPSAWRGGWYPSAAALQVGAMAPGTEGHWWAAGGKVPVLLIQGLQDLAAVPENARMFQAEFLTRVELVEIDHMGHAAFPEQPAKIADAVRNFLRRQ